MCKKILLRLSAIVIIFLLPSISFGMYFTILQRAVNALSNTQYSQHSIVIPDDLIMYIGEYTPSVMLRLSATCRSLRERIFTKHLKDELERERDFVRGATDYKLPATLLDRKNFAAQFCKYIKRSFLLYDQDKNLYDNSQRSFLLYNTDEEICIDFSKRLLLEKILNANFPQDVHFGVFSCCIVKAIGESTATKKDDFVVDLICANPFGFSGDSYFVYHPAYNQDFFKLCIPQLHVNIRCALLNDRDRADKYIQLCKQQSSQTLWSSSDCIIL